MINVFYLCNGSIFCSIRSVIKLVKISHNPTKAYAYFTLRISRVFSSQNAAKNRQFIICPSDLEGFNDIRPTCKL